MTSVAETPMAAAPRRKRSPVLHFIGRLFREKPLGAAGAVVFVLFLLCGIFADFERDSYRRALWTRAGKCVPRSGWYFASFVAMRGRASQSPLRRARSRRSSASTDLAAWRSARDDMFDVNAGLGTGFGSGSARGA